VQTGRQPPSLALIKSAILDFSLQNLVQIVAVPIPLPASIGISDLVNKFKNYTIDKAPIVSDVKGKCPDISAGISILGYAVLLPYADGLTGNVKCYDRTARLNLSSVDESVLGEEMYRNVNRALVDEAIERSREQGDRWKTVLTSTTFSEADWRVTNQRTKMSNRFRA
jgi:hypothetical protein